MAVDDFAPSPGQTYQWGQRKRNAAQGLARREAQNTFDRRNIYQNRKADVRSLGQQFMQMRNRIPEAYGRRGLMASGLYGQGLQDYGQQRTQAYGDLSRKYQQMLGQLRLGQQNYREDYANSMSDIASEEAVRRAELAAQLRMFM